jgi:anti-anti-sigma factor
VVLSASKPRELGRRHDDSPPYALRPGDHLCWSFADDAAFTAAAVACVAEGLEAGERVVFSASGRSEELLGRLGPLHPLRAVDRGALVVVPVHELYGDGKAIDPEEQVARYASLVGQARNDGYRGLRAVVDATELVTDPAARRRFAEYEVLVERTIASTAMSAMCSYHAGVLGSDALGELACIHPRRNAAAAGVGFCLYWAEGGFALDGEVDITNVSAFRSSLQQTGHAPGDVVDLDVRGLHFIDVGGLRAIAQFARTLGRDGRRLRLRNARPIHRRAWSAAGFGGVEWN